MLSLYRCQYPLNLSHRNNSDITGASQLTYMPWQRNSTLSLPSNMVSLLQQKLIMKWNVSLLNLSRTQWQRAP